MVHSQLHPLQTDPKTGEPFLRLPAPLNNIILTPPRPTDVPDLIAVLNDPAVYKWLDGAQKPFLEEHALARLERGTKRSDAVLKELKEAEEVFPDGPLQFLSGCPVNVLREVKADGTQVYIGDIMVRRCLFWEVGVDSEDRQKAMEENNALEVGDPNIVWSMGDYLASSHHGRGIMSAAIGTFIREWMIPRMNAQHITSHAFGGNVGSVRVFEKNGFVQQGLVRKIHKVTEAGFLHESLHVLSWKQVHT